MYGCLSNFASVFFYVYRIAEGYADAPTVVAPIIKALEHTIPLEEVNTLGGQLLGQEPPEPTDNPRSPDGAGAA